MSLLATLEKYSQPDHIPVIAGLVLTGIIGVIDYLIGFELSFSVFYVLPIALVTWLTNLRLGFLMSLVCAFVWFTADIASGHDYTHPLIPVWNTLIRLAFFMLITLLLSSLKKAAETEKELARTDNLTGAVNSRFFYNLAQMEIDRFHRYQRPFTLAYIDLDNFKPVNDKYGHPVGDQALRKVVDSAKKHLRVTDVIARLGGDEFVLLLPETNEDSARVALTKIQTGLLEEMRLNHWPITFSIGVLTCNVVPNSTEDLVKMADQLMYSAKHGGKNAVKYHTYTGQGSSSFSNIAQ
ncbi:MAG TPA: GGDEF domain-containing protein [Gammaproteobacteria bacterium]